MIAHASNPQFTRRREAFRCQLAWILTGKSGAWVLDINGDEAVIIVDRKRQRLWITMPVGRLVDLRLDRIYDVDACTQAGDPRLVVNGRWLWAEYSCSMRGLTTYTLLERLQQIVDLSERCCI